MRRDRGCVLIIATSELVETLFFWKDQSFHFFFFFRVWICFNHWVVILLVINGIPGNPTFRKTLNKKTRPSQKKKGKPSQRLFFFDKVKPIWVCRKLYKSKIDGNMISFCISWFFVICVSEKPKTPMNRKKIFNQFPRSVSKKKGKFLLSTKSIWK